MPLGYDRRLFILAFDHRGSFQKKMFGISGEPNAEEARTIADAKSLIFEGFQLALSDGAPHDAAGVLVDEQFGETVASKAKADGLILAMPVEKSGLDEFDFEYGSDFGAHLGRLRELSAWLHARDRKFLFELLVAATPAQLSSVGDSEQRYEAELRPGLMVGAIHALQEAGVEPDVWKIEGVDSPADCERIAAEARAGGRDGVSCVVLGRGADSAQVDSWLRAAAGVPGYVGFAIGRSIFWDAVKGWLDTSQDRGAAARLIADNYRRFIDVYEAAAP